MHVLYLWTLLLVAFIACKPIARQEPVSNEQVLLVFKKLLMALENSDLVKAQKLIFGQERVSSVRDLVGEASARGHTKKLAKIVENYRVPLPAAEDINTQIVRLQRSFDPDVFITELLELRDITRTTYLEFKKLETVIKSSNLSSALGAEAYVQQLNRLNTEFKSWAKPLRGQIDVEVTRFLQGGNRGEMLSLTDSMRIADEVLKEWNRIENILDSQF